MRIAITLILICWINPGLAQQNLKLDSVHHLFILQKHVETHAAPRNIVIENLSGQNSYGISQDNASRVMIVAPQKKSVGISRKSDVRLDLKEDSKPDSLSPPK